MERFINYSDVFEIDVNSVGSVEVELSAITETALTNAYKFLELDFTDIFLTIAAETSNEGTVKVFAKTVVTDGIPKTLKEIEELSIFFYKTIEKRKSGELVFAEHLTTRDVSTDNIVRFFDEIKYCSTFESHVSFLTSYEPFLLDFLFYNQLLELFTVTPRSKYTFGIVGGLVRTFNFSDTSEEIDNDDDLILTEDPEEITESFFMA